MQEYRNIAVRMGCPECQDVAAAAGEIQPICNQASTEDECGEVNPGGAATFGSGSLPVELTAEGMEAGSSERMPSLLFLVASLATAVGLAACAMG